MSTTPTELLETTVAATEAAIAETVAAAENTLDFDSIKELMDAFDPAALLPELSQVFGSLPAVCRFAVMIGPIVLLILGLSYLFLAPKEANYYFGYRCYFGMGSVYAWRFTQRFAGLVLGLTGLVLTIVMYTISGGFDAMEVTDMVWKALDCLVWQAVIALIANLTVNLTAAFLFDRKGNYRRKKKHSK